MNEHGNADALSLLGASKQDYPTDPALVPLETIPWQPRSKGTVVTLHCPEFTSLCPKTAQPDFGTLIIQYEPDNFLIESKAIKMYLFAFRQHGAFHEVTVERIAQDLFEVLSPRWLRVRGEYLPRGGISIWPTTLLLGEGVDRSEVSSA